MRCWRAQRGFTLIEVTAALVLIGTVVGATVSLMAATSRTSARAEESITLLQLARAQTETIEQSPFKQDPADYPTITGIPEGFTVTFVSTDPGTRYSYPSPSTTTLTSVVQQITVTATGDFSELSQTFYKIRVP